RPLSQPKLQGRSQALPRPPPASSLLYFSLRRADRRYFSNPNRWPGSLSCPSLSPAYQEHRMAWSETFLGVLKDNDVRLSQPKKPVAVDAVQTAG
ncbi:MAG: hypothetical protein WA177_20545, partial [Xanthobacteraceae bacterium]